MQPPPLRAPSRTFDSGEITILYKRSQDLITQGDIAGGRLLLTRAAEAGDARAALALGATYDAAVLGVVADAAKAWYAKAAEFGSGEAVRRLEVLALASFLHSATTSARSATADTSARPAPHRARGRCRRCPTAGSA